MRVLLDTNVWRYLVDTGYHDHLYKITRQFGVTIVVAPMVVIETLRMNDSALRKKIVSAQSSDCWDRLMPDAYLQSEDVKRVMLRLHPEWALKNKNITQYNKLRYDWLRTKGGFWEKVKTNTDAVARQYHFLDASTLSLVRQQSRDVRSSVLESGEGILNNKPLNQVMGSWTTLKGEKVELDGWRVYAEGTWENLLAYNNSLRQWLECEIDINLLLTYYAFEFVKFWESEVQVEEVPREWLRAALYMLQSERKVTDGNPTDSAIAVHLVDADVFVSADKAFVTMANQIRSEAKFKTAHGFLVGSGKKGMEKLFQMFADRVFLGLRS
jgi:hypothetical protein